MKQVQLTIEGMSYSSCADNLEKALCIIKGVHNVRVDFERKEADIEYDENEVSPSRLIQLIEDTGYSVVKRPHLTSL